MNNLKTFITLLAILFALPWLFLILFPYLSMAEITPVPYSEDDGTQVAWGYPAGAPGMAMRGAEIYARNGCAYCHTQMIRPTYAGADRWREGWAGRAGDGDENMIRETRPRDYMYEDYAPLGVARNGPDLSNVGWRITDESWHYQHLYDPRSVREESYMPAFRNLFEKRKVQLQRSEAALDVELPEGDEYEIVPTEDARALVYYLLSLKKDAKVPSKVASSK